MDPGHPTEQSAVRSTRLSLRSTYLEVRFVIENDLGQATGVLDRFQWFIVRFDGGR